MIRLVEVIWNVDLSFSHGFSRDLTFKNYDSTVKFIDLPLQSFAIIEVEYYNSGFFRSVL